MSQIVFGTDGWRAVIAKDFTFANVERVAQAAADYWKAHPVPGTEKAIIVGYDRRFLSDQFGRSAAAVFLRNGFDVMLTSVPTPTPAVSYAVKKRRAVGGVMITASHNPAAFNGFKLKAHFGGSADEATCRGVEAALEQLPEAIFKDAGDKAEAVAVTDLRPAHYAAIKGQVDFKLIARSKLRFAHDAMFGVGAGCFEQLLAGTRCRVTALRGQHDPNFGGINPEPIWQNYAQTSAWLRKHPHDLCLVTDGDADRVGAMDGRGGYLTSHQIICLLLYHIFNNRQGRGRMVKALNTTSMLDKMCAAYGLGLTETSVGFKHITPELLKGDAILGAEDSGGIAFPEFLPERDGLLAGLMLLELLATEKVSIGRLLKRLEKQFGPHRYGRIDLPFPLEKRPELLAYSREHPPKQLLRSPVVEIKTFDGVKFIAQDSCWLLLRSSGTEPIVRLYAEAQSENRVRKLLRMGMQMTEVVKGK